MSPLGLSRSVFNRILKETINGYGFEEITQHPDGLYCVGCGCVHKKPTKMYKGGLAGLEVMCAVCVVSFYGESE